MKSSGDFIGGATAPFRSRQPRGGGSVVLMSRWCAAWVFVCVVWLVPAAALAQVGSVAGRVVDPQGAAVGGADVVLAPAAGPTRSARSRPDGAFSFDNVAPGTYTVRVEAGGFAPFAQSVTVATGAGHGHRVAAGGGRRRRRDRAGRAARHRQHRQDHGAGARSAADGERGPERAHRRAGRQRSGHRAQERLRASIPSPPTASTSTTRSAAS